MHQLDSTVSLFAKEKIKTLPHYIQEDAGICSGWAYTLALDRDMKGVHYESILRLNIHTLIVMVWFCLWNHHSKGRQTWGRANHSWLVIIFIVTFKHFSSKYHHLYFFSLVSSNSASHHFSLRKYRLICNITGYINVGSLVSVLLLVP